MKLRRGICYVLTGCSCLVELAGCLPLVPGTFAMMCLEGGNKAWLLLCTTVALASTVSWIEAVRYILTVVVILFGSALLEKVNGRRDSMQVAILTFVAVFLVGISGVFMDRNLMGAISVALEGLLGFGVVLTFNRFVHWFLTPKERIFVTSQIPEAEKNERVRRYISACEKLAEVFAVPQYEYATARKTGEKRPGTNADTVWDQSRMAISQQLQAIATNIEKCTQQRVYLCKEDQQQLRQLEYELKENGVSARAFFIYQDEDGRHRVEFIGRSIAGQNVSVRNVAELVGTVLGMPMIAQTDMKTFLNKEERKLVFLENGRYQVLSGSAKLTPQGERICGDNESCFSLSEGKKKVLAVSDGMGCGPRANKESELVLEVTEELLGAGFTPEQALPMLNAACGMGSLQRGCSTLDLCEIDTFTGTGSWYKMGAAASFFRRGKEVEVIYGNTLPVGAVEHAKVWKRQLELADGDTIVLMTDGVLEALPVSCPEEMMKDIIGRIEEEVPEKIAEKILEIVMQLKETEHNDDMLVSVLKIWER